MMIDIQRAATVASALSVALDEGSAEHMGDGMFVVFQMVDGVVQRLVLSADDLRRMLALA